MNTSLSKSNLVIAAIAGLLAIVLAFAFIQQVKADITSDVPTVTQNTFRYYRFFATSTAQTNYATSTVGTAALNYATSTNINQWTDGNGAVDNGYFVVAGAKSVEFMFGRGATSTTLGTSTFAVQVTSKPNPSESDWYTYTGLAPATTTSMTPTLVSITAIAMNAGGATTTNKFTMNNLYESIYAVRCITTIAVGGANTCEAAARF